MIASPHTAKDALNNLDDERLVAELNSGHHDALAILFDKHSKMVFRLARRILGDDGEAEETVQEVFMEAYARISQFDARKGSFRNWLLANARYRAIDRKRHLQSAGVYRWVAIADYTIPDSKSTKQFPRFSHDELSHFAMELLTVLSPVERRVIDLHLFRDLTLEETHRELHSPLSAVRHLYYGAMKKLRSALSAGGTAKQFPPRKDGRNASS